jgi:hypothetical protein
VVGGSEWSHTVFSQYFSPCSPSSLWIDLIQWLCLQAGCVLP